jgi:hypothetical protein
VERYGALNSYGSRLASTVAGTSFPEAVMYVTIEGPPRVLATRSHLTSSPSAYMGPLPALATSGKVALAVRMLVWVSEILMLAVQVEPACVPSSKVQVAVFLVPLWGVALTWMVVPRGTLLAASPTITGFCVPTGSAISGAPNTLPTGLAGAETPPMLAMAIAG